MHDKINPFAPPSIITSPSSSDTNHLLVEQARTQAAFVCNVGPHYHFWQDDGVP